MNSRRPYTLLLLPLALLGSGCRSSRVIEQLPVYIHDTIRTVQTLHDSTFIDRYHTVTTNGDTVYIHDSIFFRSLHSHTDTAYRLIERPVVVTHVDTVEVKKPLRVWQRGLMWAGVTAIFGLILWLVLHIRLKP